MPVKFLHSGKGKNRPLLFESVFIFPIIVIGVVAIILQILPLAISFQEKINIVLTVAIAEFAAVEGYSTHRQVMMEEKKIQVEDALNELEKAYGPLYTLLRRVDNAGKKAIEINYNEKAELDEIFATYPFMFPSNIYDFWKQKIRNMETGGYSLEPETNEEIPYYDIPLDFRDMIIEEYERRVKKYNEILRK